MKLTELLFNCLFELNRFLYHWSRSLAAPSSGKTNKVIHKQYQYILQDFVLLKTKYQVWTKALDRKVEQPKKEIFEVKVLES